MRHLVYTNVDAFWRAAANWLLHENRRPYHTLGLGIDRSDSLLYEGITGHARELIALFLDPSKNRLGCYLVLLTKSINVHYLPAIAKKPAPIALTFSLNPEAIADLWEGKYADNGERITPSIDERLRASVEAQKLGYETRWRLDPILTPSGWLKVYEDFFAQAASLNARPHFITLGTYREKTPQLDHWREFWGLPSMEWTPTVVSKQGTHRHISEKERSEIYLQIKQLITRFFPSSFVTLCRETYAVRRAAELCGSECNCLKGTPNSDAALARL